MLNRYIIALSISFIFAISFLPSKLNAEAEQVWHHTHPCDQDGYGCGKSILAVTDSGYVYMAFMVRDDMVIVRYDQAGNFLWERVYGTGGTSVSYPRHMVVDAAGSVYISGEYNPDWTVFSGPMPYEYFTVKYYGDGTLAWENSYLFEGNFGSPGVVCGNELSNDESAIYVTGYSGMIFASWPPDVSACPDFIYEEVLIKYDAVSGAQQWVVNPGGYVNGLAASPGGGVYVSSIGIVDEGCCIDTLTHDSTAWRQNGIHVAHFGGDGAQLGGVVNTIDNFDACNPEPHSYYTKPIGGIASDDLGYAYVVMVIPDSSGENDRRVLHKYNPSLNLEWETEISNNSSNPDGAAIAVDGEGNIIFADWFGTYRYDNAGNLLWTGQGGDKVCFDDYNNLYVVQHGSNTINFYDRNGIDAFPEWSVGTPSTIFRMHVDPQGRIYTSNKGTTPNDFVQICMYAQEHYVRFLGAQEDTLKNLEFDIYRVHNDPPYFTEDTLGRFETDSSGYFKFPLIPNNQMVLPASAINLLPDTLSRGDTIRVARYIDDSATVKHPHLTDKMYTIHLDNLNFDSLGVPLYDTIVAGLQDMVIDHSEIRYNLVASVQWDASQEYLESLEESFRSMSNYLYDITDGQARLDTVLIYDDSAHWDDADIRIFADNQQWPVAWADSVHSSGAYTISMPRKWYGGDNSTRNQTYHDHPLNLNEPKNYRTKIHEFGHYAFGFYDEYLYWDLSTNKYSNEAALRCSGIPFYGFMEYQYSHNDPYTTEMSNEYHYTDNSCQNTKQYGVNGASCWENFESKFERGYITDSNDTIFVEIFTPNDTNRNSYSWPSGFVYLEGPNNDMTSPMTLDYDIGSKVVFPVSPTHPSAEIKEVDVEVKVAGNPVPGAEVFLLKQTAPLTFNTFKQGKTADNGKIWVLGAENGDKIQSAGFNQTVTKSLTITETWHSGEVTIGADSMTLDLNSINGYFPMICDVTLNETSFDLQLINDTNFASLPTLTYRPSSGGQYDYTFGSITDGYNATITESSGLSGDVTINAEDNSSDPFFFVNSYTHASFTPSASEIEFFGPSGESQILFNDSNETMSQAMLLSSPYTIIRTGLTDANIQASKTHSLSVYPEGLMTGSGLFRIHYSEGDLVARAGSVENEASIKIFKWVDKTTGWQEVGGTVDTVLNQAVETITEPGVYAAFTTDASVDVYDEQSSLLPYSFELSQNYPNPFNPVTTISYSLLRRSDVTIDIFNILGQKIITILDENKPAGEYKIEWDGNDSYGHKVSTGIYFYRFKAGDYVETKKMLLLK